MTRMAKRFMAVLCGVLSFAASAQALQWEPQDGSDDMRQDAQAQAHHAYTMRLAGRFEQTDDARAQAFAAVLRGNEMLASRDAPPAGDVPSMRVPADGPSRARLQAAAAKAGGDVIANQLLIAAARADAAGLRTEAARRWQAADPGNAMPLLYMDLPAETLLVEARRATHADPRMYDLVRWMMSAMLRHPPTPEEQALLAEEEAFHVDEHAAISAMALWAAVIAPGYSGLMQSCRGEALRAAPTRHGDCRHVATLLAGPVGSAADQGIGLAMLRELAGSAAERSEVEARQRKLYWQMMEWGRVSMAQPRDGAAQFVRLLGDEGIRTEQQLVERVLQEAGVPLDPPAGWSPPRN